jgi:hypothetical protein
MPDFKVNTDELAAKSDFALANDAAGFDRTPKGYTWHHVEDGRTMELVPSDRHGTVRHSGGVAALQSGRDGPVLFWDHEEGFDPPDESNPHEIAPDLQTFLGSLIGQPQTPPPRPGGLRRLFRR